MNKIVIGWEEFGEMADKLAEQIKGDFDGIYAMPRGGLPLAVTLSHRLKLPLLMEPTKETLIVDDISDTGESLKNISGEKIACLHSTPWTITKPDWFVKMKENKEDWIVYPWEKESDRKD